MNGNILVKGKPINKLSLPDLYKIMHESLWISYHCTSMTIHFDANSSRRCLMWEKLYVASFYIKFKINMTFFFVVPLKLFQSIYVWETSRKLHFWSVRLSSQFLVHCNPANYNKNLPSPSDLWRLVGTSQKFNIVLGGIPRRTNINNVVQ